MAVKKKSTKKRSSKKILDAFQIAERAENGSDSDNYNSGSDDDLTVQDGVLDASKFFKELRRPDGKFDDEEIDSDEALGSDDDYDILNSKFSQTIRDKAKKRKTKEKKRRRGEQVSSDESEEEEDEDEAGYASIDESQLVSLSEAWDMDDADLEKHSKSKSKSKSDSNKNELVFDEDAWETESSQESDSDEEDEEDEGEDLEVESEEDIFRNESGEEEDDELDLSHTVSHLKSQMKKPEIQKKRLLTETREENEFVLPTGGNKLSLSEMMAAVDSSVSNEAFLIDKDAEKSKALATPLPKRIQERHERKAAYEITKEEVSKWEDAVQSNRQAEVLKFPLNATVTHNDTASTFKTSTEPTTELEKRIHDVLTESSLLDDKKEATFEEIAVAKMSAEEMKKRTNELRLMRELMFRDEKRAKRIKKIKSKQYHKIQKKERLRNQELVEGSDAESDGEDHDLKRARERMTLKHKTQSSWAKSMIKSGLSKDSNNRAELEEMLRQGEKLRAKQLGYEDGDQSDEGVSDIERDYSNDDENADESIKKLGKGVLGMDFMRNAEERSRQSNLKELEELRRLENEKDLDSFEDSNSALSSSKNQGRRVYAPSAASANAELNTVNQITIAEITEEESGNLTNKLSKKFDVVDSTKQKQKSKEIKEQDVNENEEEELNPWLVTSANETSQKSQKITVVDKSSSKLAKAAAKIAKSKKRKQGKNYEDEDVIDMGESMKIVDHHPGSESEDEDVNEVRMFKQKDLIKQAFAGDDVVQEFEIEKKRVVREEDDKEEDMTLPGWGDWAGGNKKSKKRKVVRKVDGVVQKDKRKDKNLKNVIINEKVNKKNLKYQSSAVPFPFESREQYERSLRMPLGQEWTSRETHQRMTMPRIITKQGTVIDPLKAPFK